MAEQSSEVVKDRGKWEWSELWKKEDWMAIWLGFLILIAGIIIYFPYEADMQAKIDKAKKKYGDKVAKQTAMMPKDDKLKFKTIAMIKLGQAKAKVKAVSGKEGKAIKKFTSKPKKWSGNPIDTFYMSDERAQSKQQESIKKYETLLAKEKEVYAKAQTAEKKAEAAGFKNPELNTKAKEAIALWTKANKKTSKPKKKAKPEKDAKSYKKAKGYSQIPYLLGFMVVLGLFCSIGAAAMGQSVVQFLKGFWFVFLIAVLAYVLAAQTTIKFYGIGYAAWAIIIGMLISNTVGTPDFVKPAVQTEYYIKIGLVLLGAEILFSKLVLIGIPGIFVAWIVTPIVLVTTYIFGQKIVKMPSKELNITISADMSVCGVSAAIATAAACRAKKEELTLSVGLSLVFTAVMMIAMPAIIKYFFPADKIEILGGAWMGGTIDATGAVAAAGEFLGEKALYVAATIKMIQNVLIGVTAFFVALYWTTKIEAQRVGHKVGAMEIWYRFPKFVIGFILASVIFSLFHGSWDKDLGTALVDQGVISGMSKIGRGWFFNLAFCSIGLATNFRELAHYFKGGKPLILYVCGQSFNLALTLTMAYIMFYVVFKDVTLRIQQ